MLLTLIKFAGMQREAKSFLHSCARVFVLGSNFNENSSQCDNLCMSNKKTENLGKVRGIVKHGRGDGVSLGFRTANLEVPRSSIPVDEGVYAAYVEVGNQCFRAAVSVGVSPLFKAETHANIEAHILDFDSDLYGNEITIEFVEFLRPMINFTSTQELISTVQHNINQARALPL